MEVLVLLLTVAAVPVWMNAIVVLLRKKCFRALMINAVACLFVFLMLIFSGGDMLVAIFLSMMLASAWGIVLLVYGIVVRENKRTAWKG